MPMIPRFNYLENFGVKKYQRSRNNIF